MPIYKPSELIDFLKGLGISPRKGLSQNFLIDGNIVNKIIRTAEIEKGDLTIEIGSGPGSLTEAILHVPASVIAIEKDLSLAKALERLDPTGQSLKILSEDVLTADLAPFFPKNKKVKVLGNIPYHITAPILAKFVPLHQHVDSLTVMVQEEVARRITAKPGTKDFSSFALFIQFYAEAAYAFKVSKNCFFPAPRVDSAIVHLVLKTPDQTVDAEKLFLMIRSAFQMRRKILKNSLKEYYSIEKIDEALNSLGIKPLARPEELSLEQYISLLKELENRPLS